MRYSDLFRENGKFRKVGENEFIPRRNLIGEKIGRLFVESFAYKRKRTYYYNCICDCGNKCVKSATYLVEKRTPHKSCGCWHKELYIKSSSTHKMAKSDTYKSWSEIKYRCYNPQCKAYKYYGGRGIKMCDRWLHSFENFLADMGERPSKKHSIDRIDVNGDYEPSNCRWTTMKEQCNNRRCNIIITYMERTQTLTQWCNELGLNYPNTRTMLKNGKKDFGQIVEYYKAKRENEIHLL